MFGQEFSCLFLAGKVAGIDLLFPETNLEPLRGGCEHLPLSKLVDGLPDFGGCGGARGI